MKKMQTNFKAINIFLLVFLIITGISCKDQKGQKNPKKIKEQMDQLDDGDSFAGSRKRADICQLLTKDDVRSVLDLGNAVELKQKESHNAICSYEWTTLGDQAISHSISLNFARGKKRTNSQIDAAWKSQNKGVYKKWQPKEVSGVGDRASWSDLGGGQLRVAVKGYIFYVSYAIRVIQGEKSKDTQAMIAKTKALAKKVIERL